MITLKPVKAWYDHALWPAAHAQRHPELDARTGAP